MYNIVDQILKEHFHFPFNMITGNFFINSQYTVKALINAWDGSL